jgi:hypothetical protein
MNPVRRRLCIVSRDPVQCSELVLSLQALLDPDDEVEIIMDRRRAHVLESERGHHDEPKDSRRQNPDVDLAVRTQGFAIVAASSVTCAAAEPDADDRTRFENIVSFRRSREPRAARMEPPARERSRAERTSGVRDALDVCESRVANQRPTASP